MLSLVAELSGSSTSIRREDLGKSITGEEIWLPSDGPLVCWSPLMRLENDSSLRWWIGQSREWGCQRQPSLDFSLIHSFQSVQEQSIVGSFLLVLFIFFFGLQHILLSPDTFTLLLERKKIITKQWNLRTWKFKTIWQKCCKAAYDLHNHCLFLPLNWPWFFNTPWVWLKKGNRFRGV